MIGTLINFVAIVVGTAIGLLLGNRLPERIRRTVTDGIGLFVVVLGVANALETFGPGLANVLGRAAVIVILGSVIAGSVLGELLDLDGKLTRIGERLRDRFAKDDGSHFVEGFVAMSLIACVGPLTLLGALQDGLSGDYELLAVKSMLDGFTSLALASVLGIGVGFSALTVLVVQGAIALGASALSGGVDDALITAMTAVGGFLVVGIGLRLLDLREVRVANMLPALVVAPVVVALWP